MKSKKLLIILPVIAVCIGLGIFFGISKCSNDPVKIESANLIVDYTCYIGNTNCPKLKVKVKNTSKSTYFVYIDTNFYYKGEFVTSESSAGITLTAGDTYTFEIQSTSGTNLIIDAENWSYKITNIHTIKK